MRLENEWEVCSDLSDRNLVQRLFAAVDRERECLVHVLRLLGEIDARKIYLRAACNSLYGYCSRVLKYGEGAAYRRMAAARLLRRVPRVADWLLTGKIHLTTLTILGQFITPANVDQLLGEAAGKTKGYLNMMAAQRKPKLQRPPTLRALPSTRPAAQRGLTDGGSREGARGLRPAVDAPSARGSAVDEPTDAPKPVTAKSVGPVADEPSAPNSATAESEQSGSAPRRPVQRVEPVAGKIYRLQIDVSEEFVAQLQELQALSSHRHGRADMAGMLFAAMARYADQLKRERFGLTKRPLAKRPNDSSRKRTRHIPADVRRAVYDRDGGRCTFEADGRRCDAADYIEFDHIVPYGKGGDHGVDNIRLRCRSHNGLAAQDAYGAKFMRDKIAERTRTPVQN